MKTTKQIAIKYGVPMPDTCKELDWQDDVLFYWYYEYQEWLICTHIELEESNNRYDKLFVVAAPQMHEIAQELPMSIVIEDERFSLDLMTYSYFKKSHFLRYKNIAEKRKYGEFCENHHYAEAYARMHITLRNLGLL